ncbi:MAG: amidohydrolase family protein [Nitrospiraceae bacterium]|nr:amidohydrolase family protein [Nitrospiraceae bacterium]
MFLKAPFDFVDIHTHGLGQYDTRTRYAEVILKIAALHGEKGTGMILPTIYPSDMKTMRAQMGAVKEAMRSSRSIGGINLEGPFVNPARCGALNRDAFLTPSLSALDQLLEGFGDAVKIITVAPELPGALEVIEKCASMGIRVSMGHSDATFEEAREGKKAGASSVTHLFNAMRHLHHREPGLAGFALLDDGMYVEIIPDGVHLSPETLKLVFRMKRPEKIIIVSDSVKGRMGRPVVRKGKLTGGGKTLLECAPVLQGVGVSPKSIRMAGRSNPLEFLGMKGR